MVCRAVALRMFALACMLGTDFAAASGWPEKLVGHGGPITAISISADGTHALTASFDYTLILWNLTGPQGTVEHRMVGHDAAVNDVEFTRDGTRAVSVSDDGSLGIWNLSEGELERRIRGDSVKSLDLALSPDGRYAADARWDATVRLYDLELGRETAALHGHLGNVNAVDFSHDGKKLYSAANDGQILQWDTRTGRMERPVYRHGWGINAIAALDGNRLLFGAANGSVGLVSLKSDEMIQELARRKRPVQSVKVSADGALFGYADGSGQIGVYSAETAELVESEVVAFGPVWDFDFVPDSNQAYHVGLDDFAIRWQISPREPGQVKSKFPRRFQQAAAEDPGELEFKRKCSVCHTLTPDDANRAGPTLYGVFGRMAGGLPGYAYSQALYDSQVIWNEDTIGRLFGEGPDIMMPGTKMPIQRLKSVERRDDLIRYLKVATAPNEEKR